jgi:hypothetical protein
MQIEDIFLYLRFTLFRHEQYPEAAGGCYSARSAYCS